MLEAVTQNIGAGLVIINKDYRILWANKFLTELNGEVENKICYLTFSKQNLICADCGVKKVFEGTASDSREYFNEMLHSKGLPCWFELIATPIKDKEGNVIAALELTVDITEKKFLQNKLAKHSERLEEEVEERTDQLRQTQVKLVKSERLAAIGELAGMIGHDLRNPLTGIKNAAYFLKRKGLTIPESDHAAMLEIIEKGVTHSDKIISDLIDYAKDLHLYLQTCEIQKVLREALAKVPIPDKIEIINNIPKELVIKVDEDSMERVFVNLTKNSIEAMPEGGTITLDCSTTENTVEISFSDTGIGINEEAMPKLFFPLLTTKAQGMGFGLANCRRIIEAHGGTISVKSAKGKGTIFLISLPFRNTLENERGKIWINIPGSSSLASKMQEL